MQCPDPVTALCSCYQAPRSSGILLTPSVVWVTFVVKTSAAEPFFQCLLCRANKSADDLLSRLLGAPSMSQPRHRISLTSTQVSISRITSLFPGWSENLFVCLTLCGRVRPRQIAPARASRMHVDSVASSPCPTVLARRGLVGTAARALRHPSS